MGFLTKTVNIAGIQIPMWALGIGAYMLYKKLGSSASLPVINQ
jgi:hypothetical protein